MHLAASPEPSTLAPSADWNGTAGSGFDGSYGATPSDPVRATAKPTLHLAVAPLQTIIDELVVGVFAAANNGGSLLDALGIEKVIFHYEGETHEVLAPTFQTPQDLPAGIGGKAVAPRAMLGWWVTLKHNGTNGMANLYVEAVPKDATMQNRVIGPYKFVPRATEYDKVVTIAATGPVVAKESYNDIGSALNAIRNDGHQTVHLDVTEAGSYELLGLNQIQTTGLVTISASVPGVVFGVASAAALAGTYSDTRLRPRSNNIRIMGANITMDFAYAREFYGEGSLGQYVTWMDGIRVTNSRGRDALLWKNVMTSVSYLFRLGAWLTEVAMDNVHQAARSAALCRGCTFSATYVDLFSSGGTIAGGGLFMNNEAQNHDSATHITPIDALTVTGPAGATLSLSGRGGDSTRTFTAKEGGVAVGTYNVTTNPADHHADANYHVHNVAAWINGLPGWSATVLDDTRLANAMTDPDSSGAGVAGSFTDTHVSSAHTFITEFDIHPDVFQGGTTAENCALVNTRAWDVEAQSFFPSDSNYKDLVAINNAFANREPVIYNSQVNSKPTGSTNSHMVIAHSTWSTQDLWLRCSLDAYSLVANNTGPDIFFLGGSGPAGAVVNNHLQAGATGIGDAGETVGGTALTLFADAANGDFTPAGELLANLEVPVVRYDLSGAARGATAPKGAVA